MNEGTCINIGYLLASLYQCHQYQCVWAQTLLLIPNSFYLNNPHKSILYNSFFLLYCQVQSPIPNPLSM